MSKIAGFKWTPTGELTLKKKTIKGGSNKNQINFMLKKSFDVNIDKDPSDANTY